MTKAGREFVELGLLPGDAQNLVKRRILKSSGISSREVGNPTHDALAHPQSGQAIIAPNQRLAWAVAWPRLQDIGWHVDERTEEVAGLVAGKESVGSAQIFNLADLSIAVRVYSVEGGLHVTHVYSKHLYSPISKNLFESLLLPGKQRDKKIIEDRPNYETVYA